jgi:Fe-S-cluster containining protein
MVSAFNLFPFVETIQAMKRIGQAKGLKSALLGNMKNGKPFPIPVRSRYSCAKCPAYCCSYPEIEVTSRDIERLARHFDLAYGEAEERFTKYDAKEKVRLLRHRRDRIFASVCSFLDQKTRRCTVYEARPAVCRDYPDSPRCGYYEFLKFERAHQDDPKFIALT